MLSVSRAVVSKHREISALLATYAMFLSGVLVLAWAASRAEISRCFETTSREMESMAAINHGVTGSA